MSWLSDFLSALKPSSREEHFWAKIAGEEELENEYLPSSREEGFMYKIAEKIQGGSLPDASEASEGDVLTIDDGEPVWAAGGGGSGGGGSLYVVNYDASTLSTGKTAGEIFEHLETDRVVFQGVVEGTDIVFQPLCWIQSSGGYYLYASVTGQTAAFYAESSSDYMQVRS